MRHPRSRAERRELARRSKTYRRQSRPVVRRQQVRNQVELRDLATVATELEQVQA